MTSVIKDASSIRVSSVLNRDVKQFGKKYMFDDDVETCWNSDSGLPQYVILDFTEPVHVNELRIKFQGGFVGKDCQVQASNGESEFTHVTDFYPEDINSLQVFKVNDFPKGSTKVKILFAGSTDFFGRITIYKLDLLGGVS
ncbi:hypothetical protein CAPTEDRAFT_175075 [Capitella teleta]|uniref:Nuclear receptor 2C2-associated protein n=1 Tax=Capitella teleta TaxID=283909 RepID=R7TR42_CAPTE|nr:hypothetical protein CAPTEDRAFT_175075 [Capitella teleta]|eukprot:ELT96047.1 hypothetical protein CAPTEDRAFT_175075 [Capitella teleta]